LGSYDFITMYLAIEMQSLCFYALAASKRHSEFSMETLCLLPFSVVHGYTPFTVTQSAKRPQAAA